MGSACQRPAQAGPLQGARPAALPGVAGLPAASNHAAPLLHGSSPPQSAGTPREVGIPPRWGSRPPTNRHRRCTACTACGSVFERGARGGATGGREGGSCDGDGGGSAARRQPRTAACSAAWPAQGSCPAPVQQASVAAHLALVPKLPPALLLGLLVPIVGLPRMEGCKSGHVAWAQESCAGMVRRATTCQLAKLHLPSSRSLPGPPATANVSQNRHWNWHRNHNAFPGWPPTLTTRDCHCV